MTSDDAAPPEGAAAELEPAASEEKFQRPAGSCSKITCGVWIVRPVMCSVCEKISGITSTPISIDLAVRKGDVPNEGSSEMERSLAETKPEKTHSLSSVSYTHLDVYKRQTLHRKQHNLSLHSACLRGSHQTR